MALATAAPYVTWPALNDRTFFSRYLPPKTIPDLPSIDAVTELFRHGPEGQRLSPRSTLLLPCFAQWFTDGFLMTESDNRRKTKTTHQVELNQLYGLTKAMTDAVRLFSEEKGRRGRLKSEITATGEWAPSLFDAAGNRKPEFAALPDPVKLPPNLPLELKRNIFAFAGERANSTLYTAAFNTLFLREHNRLAAMLEANNPGWDDERAVPDGAQHQHHPADHGGGRGIYQPHLALLVQGDGRSAPLLHGGVEPAELDPGRVQPALPLAQPDPRKDACGTACRSISAICASTMRRC